MESFKHPHKKEEVHLVNAFSKRLKKGVYTACGLQYNQNHWYTMLPPLVTCQKCIQKENEARKKQNLPLL